MGGDGLLLTNYMNNAETVTGLDLSQWEIKNPIDKEQYYTCDAVIEAYLTGEKNGLKSEQKVLFNQFTDNVDKSKKNTLEFLKLIESFGFLPKGAYIKFDSFDLFEALIAVSEIDFVKDEFLKIYDELIKLQNSKNEELYKINFSFVPVTTELDEANIMYDGYVIRYKKS